MDPTSNFSPANPARNGLHGVTRSQSDVFCYPCVAPHPPVRVASPRIPLPVGVARGLHLGKGMSARTTKTVSQSKKYCDGCGSLHPLADMDLGCDDLFRCPSCAERYNAYVQMNRARNATRVAS
jgi:hypothetical protein